MHLPCALLYCLVNLCFLIDLEIYIYLYTFLDNKQIQIQILSICLFCWPIYTGILIWVAFQTSWGRLGLFAVLAYKCACHFPVSGLPPHMQRSFYHLTVHVSIKHVINAVSSCSLCCYKQPELLVKRDKYGLHYI